MLSDFAKKLKATLAGLGVVMLCASSAQAAQYIGEWDPAFGAPFNSLGWKGTATFEIPDACLASDGIKINGFGCATGFTLKLISAQVDFYNLANPNVILDTLNFAAPSYDIYMQVTNGQLSGVVGAFLTPDHSSLGIAGGNTDFWLGFVKSNGAYYAQLAFKQYGPCRDNDYECLRQDVQTCLIDSGFSDLNPTSGGSTFMTFSRIDLQVVPEPASLALLLPALGMLAFTRRRRSQTA